MAANAGVATGVAAALVALAGCSDGSGRAPSSASASSGLVPTASATATASAAASPAVAARVAPRPARSATTAPSEATPRRVRPPRAAAASVSIPSIGVRALRVVAYQGRPDDAPGTRIQNRGLAASPRGDRGGVGPGQIGNFIVTAHRTSAGGPFRRLPALRHGAHILVKSDGVVYDYVVTGTMTISFRSARDLARQSAPVPGHPGKVATRAMVTLSTCATPEDRAQGNYWTDEFGNPEHRIDKVGVLVATRPA